MEMKMTIAEMQEDYNWREVFKYSCPASNPVTREVSKKLYEPADVTRIVANLNGAPDGLSWVGVFEMNDGRYLTIRASCDYTGWGCQEGGDAEWSATELEAIACLSDDERQRLSFLIETGGKVERSMTKEAMLEAVNWIDRAAEELHEKSRSEIGTERIMLFSKAQGYEECSRYLRALLSYNEHGRAGDHQPHSVDGGRGWCCMNHEAIFHTQADPKLKFQSYSGKDGGT